MARDLSNGYDAVAETFMRVRSSTTGVAVLRNWMRTLPQGGSVLDVGAGSGAPLTAELIEAGFNVSAIDASPKMVTAFGRRFPDIEVACEAAEDSTFFDRSFDGLLAVGLVFLLPAERQGPLIKHMASALKPGGRMLFSAPRQIGDWEDVLTGQQSFSLGERAYKDIAAAAGLDIIGEHVDEGESYYYEAKKRPL